MNALSADGEIHEAPVRCLGEGLGESMRAEERLNARLLPGGDDGFTPLGVGAKGLVGRARGQREETESGRDGVSECEHKPSMGCGVVSVN
ncbi:MAG: hypothetical protein QF464_22660, partial [Myxococcota bacterium]|nr:hypothetical protein [Myxococcota bacterium]